jgi:ParB family chromosome partitioning protein
MNEETMTAMDVVMLKTDELGPNPWNRRVFDEPGLEDLAGSLRVSGVLEPLIVRLSGKESPRFEICSGNRRWLAAQRAEIREIPCQVRPMSDGEVRSMNLITNVQREEISVLEKARMVKETMDEGAMTVAEVATLLGKGPTWVSDLLRSLTLPPAVKAALGHPGVSQRALNAVASLPNEQAQLSLAQEVKAGTLPVDGVEQRVRQLLIGRKVSHAKRLKRNERILKSGGTQPAEPGHTVADAAVLPPEEISVSPVMPEHPAVTEPAKPVDPEWTTRFLDAAKDQIADRHLSGRGHVTRFLRDELNRRWKTGRLTIILQGILILAACITAWRFGSAVLGAIFDFVS